MYKKYRILLVDNDERLQEQLTIRLQSLGYDVVTVKSGTEALERVQVQEPDLVIFDIFMTHSDGFQILNNLRSISQIPVIVLSSHIGDSAIVKSLKLGADDFIHKPFNLEELQARIEAVRRRSPAQERQENGNLTFDHIDIDFKKQLVVINGSPVHLSLIEWRLLVELAQNAGRLIQYEQLLTAIWGPEYRDDIQLLRTWISRLRHKLGKNSNKKIINTIRKTGYIFTSS